MGNLSVDQALLGNEVAMGVANAKAGALELQANTAAEVSLQQQQAARYSIVANADSLVAAIVGNAKLATESANLKAAQDLGLDPADSAGFQAAAAQKLIQAQKDRSDAAAAVSAKRSVGIFDDPMSWFMNQLTINDDINKHNAANATVQDIEGQIAERNQAFSAQYQNNIRLQQTVTDASVAANAESIKQQALVKADEAQRQSILSASTGVMNLLRMSGDQIQFRATGVNADMQAEHLQLALNADARAARAEAIAQAKEAQSEAGSKYITDMIELGNKVLNPSSSGTGLPAGVKANLLRSLMMGKDLDPDMKALYQAGVRNYRLDPTGQARIVADSPIEALGLVANGQMEISPGQRDVISLMQTVHRNLVEGGDAKYNTLKANKDVAGATQYMNDSIVGAIKEQFRNAGDPASIAALPSLNAIVGSIPGVQQLPVYTNIIAPAIASKVDLSNPNLAVQYVLGEALSGKQNMNDAIKQLASIYKQAQALNIKTRQLPNIGVAVPESYNIYLSTGSLSKQLVDLADPKALLSAVSNTLAQKMLTGNPNRMPGEVTDTTDQPGFFSAVSAQQNSPAAVAARNAAAKAMWPPNGFYGDVK